MDDGPIAPGYRRDALVVGAVYRGGRTFEGLLSTRIRRDGANATDRLARMIRGSKFHDQLRCILLDGIALGGLNIIDLDGLHERTELPVMVVMRRPPDIAAMHDAISRVAGAARKHALLRAAGTIHSVEVTYGPAADGAGPADGSGSRGTILCQLRGLDAGQAAELLAATCTHSKIPEPVRAAHLIAAGVVLGQSGRRA